MKYNPVYHHRRSIRLKGYDYTKPGAYFLTICTQDRRHLFGEVKNGKMILNEFGLIVAEEWKRSEEIRKEITLDAFVIMPNHIHGILIINEMTDINGMDGDKPHGAMGPTGLIEIAGADDSPVRATGRSPQRYPSPKSDPTQPFDSTIIQKIEQLGMNTPNGPKPKSVGSFVAGFKPAVTKRINEKRGTPGFPVWQRNYYEHIIRNDREFTAIRYYIMNNPVNWAKDLLY